MHAETVLNILHIEDDPADAHIMRHLLTQAETGASQMRDYQISHVMSLGEVEALARVQEKQGQKFNAIFNRNNMAMLRVINIVNQRCQRCAFTAASWPSYQDQTMGMLDQTSETN